jgi:hypothetical protein
MGYSGVLRMYIPGALWVLPVKRDCFGRIC